MTLDADTEALLRRHMAERRLSFKEAINEAIRSGLQSGRPPEPFRTPTFDLGRPTMNLDRALQLASELEDEESVRKMRLAK